MTGLNLKLKITRGSEVSYLRCFSWKDAAEMTGRIERQHAQRVDRAIAMADLTLIPATPVVKVLNLSQKV